MRILFKILLAVLLFGMAWYSISRIDFMSRWQVEKMSKDQEHKLGEAIWELFINDKDIIHDSMALDAIEQLKNRLSPAGTLLDSITIFLVDDSQINAFALPGSQIIIYTGLIDFCDDPDELASVLAHEMAHIHLDHVVKKLVKEVGLNILVSLSGDQSGGLIREILKYITSTAFDRAAESEADMQALEWLQEAGIDPEKMATFFLRVDREQPSIPGIADWVSTHPDSGDRAAVIIQSKKGNSTAFSPAIDSISWLHLKQIAGGM